MSQINFTEMFLIPKDIYLNIIQRKKTIEEGEDSVSNFFVKQSLNPNGNLLDEKLFRDQAPPPPFSTQPSQTGEPGQASGSPLPPSPTTNSPGIDNNDNGWSNWGFGDLDEGSHEKSFESKKSKKFKSTKSKISDSSSDQEMSYRPNVSGVSRHKFDDNHMSVDRSNYMSVDKSAFDNSVKTTSTPAKYSKRTSYYPSFNKDHAKEKIQPSPTPSIADISQVNESKPASINDFPPPPPKPSPSPGKYPSFNKNFAKDDFKRPITPPPFKPPSIPKNSAGSNPIISPKKYPSHSKQFAKEEVIRPSKQKSSEATPVKSTKKRKPGGLRGAHLIQRILTNSDPYAILGIPLNSKLSDIEKQYRKISLSIHPDKSTHPNATEAFVKLRQAYESITLWQEELENNLARQRQEEAERREWESKQTERAEKERKKMDEMRKKKRDESFQNFRSNIPSFKPNLKPEVKPKKGPPTRTYPTSPLEPPPPSKFFQDKYFFQTGRGTWFSLK